MSLCSICFPNTVFDSWRAKLDVMSLCLFHLKTTGGHEVIWIRSMALLEWGLTHLIFLIHILPAGYWLGKRQISVCGIVIETFRRGRVGFRLGKTHGGETSQCKGLANWAANQATLVCCHLSLNFPSARWGVIVFSYFKKVVIRITKLYMWLTLHI